MLQAVCQVNELPLRTTDFQRRDQDKRDRVCLLPGPGGRLARFKKFVANTLLLRTPSSKNRATKRPLQPVMNLSVANSVLFVSTISFTHCMKHLLISLVPWMAMTAAAQQDAPRLVEVVYSNIGPAEAWRVGDECYIAPNIITAWHWPYTIDNHEATIQAEGRTVRVELKTVHGRELFPVKAMVDQLGATCKWGTDDEMDVLGEVRIVSVQNDTLSIDTTISSKPHVFSLDNPGRLVVDVRGMVLGAHATANLPENVVASQYGPDTVRVVYTSDNVPRLATLTNDPTRHFEYKVAFPKRVPYVTGTPNLVTPNPQDDGPEPETSEPAGQTSQAAPNPQSGATSGQQPVITQETSRSVSMSIPLSAPMTSSVRFQRKDLFSIDLTLVGVHFQNPISKPQNDSIQAMSVRDTGDASVIRITTARPMGVQVSSVDSAVLLTFHKPSGTAKLTGKTIVVDPGHGGKDSGARSPDGTLDEKQVTLDIGGDLASALAAAGASVIMTRNSDVFIPLSERYGIALRAGADMFVSIHANSNRVNGSRSGTTTYYHGQDSTSKILAECVEHEIATVSGMPMLGTASDFSRYKSGFAVLRGCKMPAILVETGYINTQADRDKLANAGVQKDIAGAVVKGIKEFFGDAKQEEDSK